MDPEEEQQNEMEALEAIFADDFKVVSSEVPRQFELLLQPNADGTDNHVALRLIVELPPNYPEVEANVRLRNEKGLRESDMTELQSILTERNAALVGEVSIFSLSESLREYLVEHNQPVLSMHQQMEARMAASGPVLSSEEEEAKRKREELEAAIEAKKMEPSPLGIEPGTLLTAESFAKWRALFDAEQAAIRAAKEATRPRETRLTGKQLFLQNLAKELQEDEADKMEEEPASAAAAAAKRPDGSVFFFNKDLYTDEDLLDDEDLDVESDEDDEDAEIDDEEKAAMFDTTTEVQKQLASSSISSSSSSSSSSAQPASSSSSIPAKKPSPSALSPSSSSSSSAKPTAASSSSSPSSSKPPPKQQPPQKGGGGQKGGKQGGGKKK